MTRYLLVAVLVPGLAVAEPAHRIEISLQAGTAFEEVAFGPQASFSRRVASRQRFDVLVGTTQVYRMTPMLDDENQLGAGI